MGNEHITSSVSIYRIDVNLFDGIVDLNQIPEKIIQIHNENLKNESEIFSRQEINTQVNDSYSHFLYYGNKARMPRWAGFINAIASENQEINKPYNRYASFVYFIMNSENNSIYAITGGQGNFLIQNYIDDYFGVEILSRLIKKEDRSIKTLQERGLTGSLIAASKIFRGEASFLQEDTFGKLFKEIQADLDPAQLNILGIETNKKSTCLAKSSFKINKLIDVSTFFQIIKSIESLLIKDHLFTINRVIELNKIKNQDLIKRLNDSLVSNFIESLKVGNLSTFDFTHKDIYKFYECTTYKISKGSESFEVADPDINAISKLLAENEFIIVDAENSEDDLNKIRVEALDEDGMVITKGNLLSHLHAEILLDNKQYIKIDGKWLLLTEDFTNELNQDLASVINEIYDDSFVQEKMNLSLPEDDYNLKYLDKENTYVLHKIKEDNIELCDIIGHAESSSNLVHVKKGFDASMRDLCSQIRISASYLDRNRNRRKAISQNINTRLNSLNSSQDKYLQKISTQNIPEDILVGKVFFTLAFIDNASSNRHIGDDLTKFDSNIAKYELLNLYRDLRTLGFELKLIQISEEE